jgi:hypothetical protein
MIGVQESSSTNDEGRKDYRHSSICVICAICGSIYLKQSEAHMLTQRPNLWPTRAIWFAVALALLSAFTYVLMGLDLLPVGDLAPHERPVGIIYVAAGGYLLGGLLILLRRRWLWTLGAFINGMVIFTFVQFYIDRPAVLFSAGGILSKLFQFLLEATLIYLIVTYRRVERRQPIGGRLEPQP